MGMVDGAVSDILGRYATRSVIWEAQDLSAFSRSYCGTKIDETGRPL